jgi:hypothetical protein
MFPKKLSVGAVVCRNPFRLFISYKLVVPTTLQNCSNVAVLLYVDFQAPVTKKVLSQGRFRGSVNTSLAINNLSKFKGKHLLFSRKAPDFICWFAFVLYLELKVLSPLIY